MMTLLILLLVILNQNNNSTLEIQSQPQSQVFINDILYGVSDNSGVLRISLNDINSTKPTVKVKITKNNHRDKILTVNINEKDRNIYIDGSLTADATQTFSSYTIVAIILLSMIIGMVLIIYYKSRNQRTNVNIENTDDNAENADNNEELEKVFNEYNFIRTIAEGGVGTIYKVVDRNGNNRALKIMTKYLYDSDMLNKFIGEGWTLEKIHENGVSPHIVNVFDYGRKGSEEGIPYIVLEYIEGKNLLFYIENNVFDLKSKIIILNQIIDAIDEVHKCNVIHRDLAPDNIIVLNSKDIKVKLIDFGVAFHDIHWLNDRSSGNAFGKPDYMAPEQLLGTVDDYRSDYYSFGVLAYTLINGEPPFQRYQLNSVLEKDKDHSPSDFLVDVPDSLRELIYDLLSKEPFERPQSVEAIKEGLNASTINSKTYQK